MTESTSTRQLPSIRKDAKKRVHSTEKIPAWHHRRGKSRLPSCHKALARYRRTAWALDRDLRLIYSLPQLSFPQSKLLPPCLSRYRTIISIPCTIRTGAPLGIKLYVSATKVGCPFIIRTQDHGWIIFRERKCVSASKFTEMFHSYDLSTCVDNRVDVLLSAVLNYPAGFCLSLY